MEGIDLTGIDNSSASYTPSRIVYAHIGFQPDQPQCAIDCSSPSCRTWRDFKAILLDQLGLRQGDYFTEQDMVLRVHGGQDEDDEDYFLPDDEEIDFETVKAVYVRENTMTLQVVHRHDSSSVEVPTSATLQALRDELHALDVEAATEPLTFMGKSVPEKHADERPFKLREAGIGQGSMLVGQRPVDITDDDAVDSVGLFLSDSSTIGEVKAIYIQKKGRINVPSSYLSAERHNVDRPQDHETLFSVVEAGEMDQKTMGTTKQLYLNFHAGEYEVSVQEERHEPITINVYDYWTVQQLKEAYTKNEMAYEGLMDQDKLIFGSIYLDELNTLYEHKVQPDAVVTIEREDIHQITTAYVCGDCGRDVLLKPQDAVRCRKCGHRIVYKKRTTIPVQFLAR